MNPITVIKRNPEGEEVWRYSGIVLQRTSRVLVLDAYFNRDDMLFQGVLLKHGDRFVETYYFERWYNVFEIYDRDDGKLKGWYCNITKPAVLDTEDTISYVDLALDLWVRPNFEPVVLDEDEFAALDLDAKTNAQVRAALTELQAAFIKTNKPPV